MPDNHYETLGVDRDASPGAIKASFRAAVKGAHPDAGGTAEEFQRVREAYEVLSDPVRRRSYDNTLPKPVRRVGLEVPVTAAERGHTRRVATPEGPLRVTVRPGSTDGDEVEMRSPSGEVRMRATVTVVGEPGWSLGDGGDVIRRLPVSPFRCMLGGRVHLMNVAGDSIFFEIPEGTPDEASFALDGEGRTDRATQRRGNLIVIVQYALVGPLTDVQRAALEAAQAEEESRMGRSGSTRPFHTTSPEDEI